MVGMAKWLTHRIVIPTFEGSIPFTHPTQFLLVLLDNSQGHIGTWFADLVDALRPEMAKCVG